MADKKLVEQITSREEDFAQWYTDVVKKAELTDYSSVKGFMVIRPAGYAIWERKRARGGLCTRGGLGYIRRFQETGRTALRSSDLRGAFLRLLFQGG